MSFDPETVRAFEHAGWQQAAAAYDATFARATAPFVEAAGSMRLSQRRTKVLECAAARDRDRGGGTPWRPPGRAGFLSGDAEPGRQAYSQLQFDQATPRHCPSRSKLRRRGVEFRGAPVPDPGKAIAETLARAASGRRIAHDLAAPGENIAWRCCSMRSASMATAAATRRPPAESRDDGRGYCACARGRLANARADRFAREWLLADPRDLIAALSRGTFAPPR